MKNFISFVEVEGLQQQLYNYQNEVNTWRNKCSQLKTELESVDLVCHFLKQENQALICKFHETESLMATNKLELAKVISDIRLQLDSYRGELDLLRGETFDTKSTSNKYSSQRSHTEKTALASSPPVSHHSIDENLNHIIDSSSIDEMSNPSHCDSIDSVTTSSLYSNNSKSSLSRKVDVDDDTVINGLLLLKRKRSFYEVNDCQSEEGKISKSKTDRSMANTTSSCSPMHSNFREISQVSSTLSENDETVQSVKSTTLKGWQFHYAAILQYCEANGTCNIPARVFYECDIPGMGHNGITYH